ncbi:MAG: hypothetical protein V4581_10925 [Bacteroidota bacterium]
MDNFDTIKSAFNNAGIDVNSAEYSFTAYSLNTPLSFKFENAPEFIAFLNLDAVTDTTIIEHLHAMLTDAGLDPNSFFYVNFYKPKVAEL